MWWKKHKSKVFIPVLVAAVLAGVFYYGGNAPGARGWSISNISAPSGHVSADITGTPVVIPTDEPDQEITTVSTETPTSPDFTSPTDSPTQTTAPTDSPVPTTEPPAKAPEATMAINPETGKDKFQTDQVEEGKPLPVEPQDVKIGTTAYTCTISISCATILDNIDLCDPEKVELVPEDGWILKSTVVTFYEGESVFNVLQRTCKQLKIHMEYVNTPIYNSAYIEGIHNLYEFDVGELSGWMYKVNEWFPNYGCSRYQLQNGDEINWVYTCDLGYDVGGGYAVGS